MYFANFGVDGRWRNIIIYFLVGYMIGFVK